MSLTAASRAACACSFVSLRRRETCARVLRCQVDRQVLAGEALLGSRERLRRASLYDRLVATIRIELNVAEAQYPGEYAP